MTATFPIGAALAKSVFGVSRIGWPVLAEVVATLLLTVMLRPQLCGVPEERADRVQRSASFELFVAARGAVAG